MRIPYKWLQEYLLEPLPPAQDIAEMLTLAGLEVESTESLGIGSDLIVVAGVSEIAPHPDADHLFVIQADAGPHGIKQIVTGAPNLIQHAKVPLAMVGATLPDGQVIEANRFRGLLSEGMLCSSGELGLPEQNPDGIMILTGDYELGANVVDILDLDDIVLDIDVTPDRADCLSMIGIAREVAAVSGLTLTLPQTEDLAALLEPSDNCPEITIEAPEACIRYVGARIVDISVKTSPGWLRRKLVAAGMRPINSIVDITNYIMLETGQPLHAFDCSNLAQDKIIVRLAHKDESLTTLDGTAHILSDDMLVIADGEKPQALAGIMGGMSSEITEDTKLVLLESASFERVSVRRTARSLGLRTEASFRYERDVDPNGALYAVQRAASLLKEMECGTIEAISDVYPKPVFPWEIELNPERTRQLIGAHVSDDFMKAALTSLHLKVKEQDSGAMVVTVPTFRTDLKRSADLVEEVARLYGFDRIPSLPLQGHLTLGTEPLEMQVERRMKEILLGMGLNEVQTYSFIDPIAIDRLRLGAEDSRRQQIPLLHPLSSEQSVLRTTLLPSLLEVVATNQRRRAENINIFEINRVYLPDTLPLTELPDMPRHVAVALNGLVQEHFWSVPPLKNDFYRLKGILEESLASFKVDGEFVISSEPYYHPGRQASLLVGGDVVATFGEVHPDVAKVFALDDRIYALELDLTAVIPHMNLVTKYRSLPRFPGIERDLSLVLPESVRSDSVIELVQSIGGPHLVELQLFDVYSGDPIERGYKSLTYSLVFRASDHTLTEEEVTPYIQSIVQAVNDKLGAVMRQ